MGLFTVETGEYRYRFEEWRSEGGVVILNGIVEKQANIGGRGWRAVGRVPVAVVVTGDVEIYKED